MTNIENLKHKASEALLPDYNNLGFHELASLMAMIEGKAKEDFKADIKLKGIQNKMMLFEGRLLDGRNRYTCGKELGFEFSEKDYDLFTGTYAKRPCDLYQHDAAADDQHPESGGGGEDDPQVSGRQQPQDRCSLRNVLS